MRHVNVIIVTDLGDSGRIGTVTSTIIIGIDIKANGNRHLNSGSESRIPKLSQYAITMPQ